jgi:hypothetical protein
LRLLEFACIVPNPIPNIPSAAWIHLGPSVLLMAVTEWRLGIDPAGQLPLACPAACVGAKRTQEAQSWTVLPQFEQYARAIKPRGNPLINQGAMVIKTAIHAGGREAAFPAVDTSLLAYDADRVRLSGPRKCKAETSSPGLFLRTEPTWLGLDDPNA